MNVFETHKRIVDDYSSYIRSFINITDPEIQRTVDDELNKGKLWPEPLLQFNPAYELAGTVAEIAKTRVLHADVPDIFTGYSLYRHQLEAIKLGTSGRDFVVTSGTGSGKSLTYIATIFNHLLVTPRTKGVTAIIVYPTNALINSQTNELRLYQSNYQNATGKVFPISFGQYTGQEKEETRLVIRENLPDILLTNYMMLELLLTRVKERPIRDGIYENLRFLVFDELHTYRGRQGADVAMLIRRIQAQCKQPVAYIGTSATMVSVGSHASQREQVADVATKVFGRSFQPEQVVDETLRRSLEYNGALPGRDALAAAVTTGIDADSDEANLRSHPVAVWLESRIALEEREGRLVRRRPLRPADVVELLKEDSGVQLGCLECLASLLLWISNVNLRIQDRGLRYTILPFKLHQFFAQTGSVYTTLDQDEKRFITLEPGIYKQDDRDKKPIFPNVFSRATGQPYICVSRIGDRLEPREFREYSEDDEAGATDGYLIVGDDVWDPEIDLEYLPEAWLRATKGGFKPDSQKAAFFPQRIYFDELGACSDTALLKFNGWFMRAPLLFDPTGGVFFDSQTNEGTKLTKLGSEGRSTSTTITAVSVLNRLREAGYSLQNQKLLSFTDNRQDAALQAGHFNDFVQVVRLRAAIYRALEAAPNGELSYKNVGEAVFTALGLPFVDFANRDSEPPTASIRREYEEGFQNFLFYRTVADLRRSWRLVLPNLEQCGLLNIEYARLDEDSRESGLWDDVPIVRDLSAEDRREFLSTILDFYRLEYAVHSQNYLTPSKLKENEKEFRERLRAPWTLDRKETLREPFVVRLRPLNRSARLFSKSMARTSALGKYIVHFASRRGYPSDALRGDQYEAFILALMQKLVHLDYLMQQLALSNENEQVPVFRLKIDSVRWKLGDGTSVKPDVIKRRSYRDQRPKPNEFFREMYRRDVSRSKTLRAEDHTGQLKVDARLDREDRFRADWYQESDKTQVDLEKIRTKSISALFCSPTMELGIDIGGLSIVHLRNAPPNAANYAQRAGRAGRSGQGALIFTYCSSYSAHDRHFFMDQADLVSGQVQAPRLDLCNEELLLTHLNALTISEIGLPGLDAGDGDRPSLMRFVVEDSPGLPMASEIRAGLEVNAIYHTRLKAAYTRVIKDFAPDLEERGSSWYSDTWVDRNLTNLADNLDRSLTRWRELYRSTRSLLTAATQPIESGRLSVVGDEYKKYKRQQDQATRQLTLLRNDADRGGDLSEFYPYRYLAAEGFLPGYNFTRLPLRIYIPTGDTAGEFISRARSVALREFGPLNLIYHSGRKYRVSQMVMQDLESSLTTAKISTRAGYFLTGEQESLELCPFSGVNLGDTANAAHLHDLLEMSESRADEVDRISCEEEERVSRGFDIQTYFSVDGGNFDRVRKAIVRTDDVHLLNLRFILAARLVHVNTKWRSQKTDGFPIGATSGNWRNKAVETASNASEETKLVKLWTSNQADALYIEPIQGLGLKPEGVITLQHALKRAVESVFQVEPNEIGVVSVGGHDSPNILLYEAAEGSLGILSRFVEDVAILPKVVDAARAICAFDDPTYLAPASYNDLLSYFNQRDHKVIDRFLIRDALDKLAICNVEIQTNAAFLDYDAQYQFMLRNLDPTSSTERRFIEHLHTQGLRLPDAAQKTVDGIYCRPDFYYEPRIWVFCDGTPHDDSITQQKDQEQRQAIIERGDEIWVWNYRDDLTTRVSQRPDIFKKVR